MRVFLLYPQTWHRPLCLVLPLFFLGRPAGDAFAQNRGTLELMPVVGAALFLNEPTAPVTTEEGVQVRSAFEEAFGFGFSIGLNFSDAIGFDASALYVPTEFSATTGNVSVGLDANVYIVGGTFRLSLPQIGGGRLEPFAAVGAGVKGYDGLIGTHTDAMWNIGAGAYVPLSRAFHLRFDVRDYMSRFGDAGDTRFQNDILLAAGLVLSL